MSKKALLLILTITMLTAPAFSHEGTKIGVVDADTVIQKSVKGKAFFEEYKAFIKTKEDEIKTMIEAFRAQEKDLQAKAASLSEDKAKSMRIELQRMQTDIKRKQEDAERETQTMFNDRLDQFRKELAPLIRQVAQDKTLDLVINFGPQSSLVYFSDNINITDDVIKKYDEMQ